MFVDGVVGSRPSRVFRWMVGPLEKNEPVSRPTEQPKRNGSSPTHGLSGGTGDGYSSAQLSVPLPPPITGGFPTLHVSDSGHDFRITEHMDSMTTTYNGQVIERVRINGSLDIKHNNVTVRDVVILGTGNYTLDIGQDTSSCPSGLTVEYVEIDMINAPDDASMPVRQRCPGGHTFDHLPRAQHRQAHAHHGEYHHNQLVLPQCPYVAGCSPCSTLYPRRRQLHRNTQHVYLRP